MPKLKALQTFSGPDGNHEKGSIFAASDDRVEFLTGGGYAEPLEQSKPAESEPKPNTARKK